MPLSDEQLQWQNRVVLTAIQALAGNLYPSVAGVSVQVSPSDVLLHVACRALEDPTREVLEDAATEIEGMLWPQQVTVQLRLHVGSPYGSWPGREHRLVFLCAPNEADEATMAAQSAVDG